MGRRRIMAMAAALLASGLPLGTGLAQQTGAQSDTATVSVLDGAFTEAQAERGETVFNGTCMMCHSPREFVGAHFQRGWNNQPVFRFFQLLQSTMPMDNPGSLSPQEYADVIAYLLKLNGYPAGKVELGQDRDALSRVRIEILPDDPDR